MYAGRIEAPMGGDAVVSEGTSPACPPGTGATLVLTVAYDGAPFCGFARQEGLPTVQGELEGALSTLLRRPAQVVCAGRTDTGVHALGQVVSLPITEAEVASLRCRNPKRLAQSLGALTADGIAVREARLARTGFSARFDAISREYRYRIVCGTSQPVFLAHWAWWIKAEDLDAGAMHEASRCLIGEHDFKSFCRAKSAEGKPTCRYLEEVNLSWDEQLGERCLTVRVVGSAFLHNMVRSLVGTLAEVGVGHRSPEWVARVLAAHDRRAAGPTAPAHGLTFWHVGYECVRS